VGHYSQGASVCAGVQHCELDGGPDAYRACDSLHERPVSTTDRHGGQPLCGGQGLAANHDIENALTIVLHACNDHSKPYLNADQATSRRAFACFLLTVLYGQLAGKGHPVELMYK